SAQIREILISESAWEEMTCLFAPSLIINAARGKLLDEGALLQVIEERNVFAALDVFSSEPLAQFSPLLHAKNIITTPHIAAATVESYQQTGTHVAQSIIDYFAGREIKNVL
ncbi:hypothetical protein ML316_17110, partial [Escherichia coli]|uniref:NAD(P)-dependent oxidoreductase n=1 Tax=Escherichia coli TaxID=562 RepID=UPI0023EA77EE